MRRMRASLAERVRGRAASELCRSSGESPGADKRDERSKGAAVGAWHELGRESSEIGRESSEREGRAEGSLGKALSARSRRRRWENMA